MIDCFMTLITCIVIGFFCVCVVVIRQQPGGMCKKLSLLLFIVLFNHDLITTYDFCVT